LRNWKVPELPCVVLDEIVRRIDLNSSQVEDVINSMVYQVGEQGVLLALTGILAAKFSTCVPGVSFNHNVLQGETFSIQGTKVITFMNQFSMSAVGKVFKREIRKLMQNR
jgi:acetyl-CoA acetyltransferase